MFSFGNVSLSGVTIRDMDLPTLATFNTQQVPPGVPRAQREPPVATGNQSCNLVEPAVAGEAGGRDDGPPHCPSSVRKRPGTRGELPAV